MKTRPARGVRHDFTFLVRHPLQVRQTATGGDFRQAGGIWLAFESWIHHLRPAVDGLRELRISQLWPSAWRLEQPDGKIVNWGLVYFLEGNSHPLSSVNPRMDAHGAPD